jgi:hypothetical protein
METFEMVGVCFGEQTMGKTQVFEQFFKFKEVCPLLKMSNTLDVQKK